MELIQRGREQTKQFGAEFEYGSIESATLDEDPKELSLSTGETVRTHALIVATGASVRRVNAENEEESMGSGLSTCATCDGTVHRGDDVLVIGGGDSAMEEALFLAKFADSGTIVHRRDEPRASEIMATRVRDHDDIAFRWNTELRAVHGSQEDGVTGATLVSHPDGYPKRKAAEGVDVTTETVDVGCVFSGIGHTPNTGLLEETSVPRDQDGYILTQPDGTGRMTTNTTVKGVFAAGDVADLTYRRAITAAGTGGVAALDAEEFLETLEETERPTVGASV